MPAFANRSSSRRLFNPRLLALAAAAALALPMAAQAVVTITGTGFTQPGSVPGNDLQWIGNGPQTTGSIEINGGDTPTFGGLFLGWNQASGYGQITGAGTTLTLNTVGGRIGVGQWGTANLSVSGGARILADGNASSCNGNCGMTIGNFAGSSASLDISGVGSEVRVRDQFNLATGSVDTVNGFGDAFGHTVASVAVENGALLATAGATTGAFNNNRLTETSTARINIVGAGSLWSLSAGSQNNAANRGPILVLSSSSTNETFMNVVAGGEVRFNGTGNVFSGINMGNNGGTARLVVSGAGSKIQFNGESTLLQVGRSAGSQAQLSVNSGGVIQGLYYMAIGRDGGNGTLTLDGTDSRISLTGTATAAANTTANVAGFDVGRGANALGAATISGGSLLEVTATTAKSNGPFANIGRDGGTGTLTVTGAGTQLRLSAASVLAGGGTGEAFNPSLNLGNLGTGNLTVSAGAKLLLQGNAVSTVAASRSTAINVGGNSDTGNGGTGVALVTGLGSELSTNGSDGFIGIGRGAGGNGIMTVADQAVVRSLAVAVGRSSGVGVLNLNNASMILTGQQTGNNLAGANLAVGSGLGTGVLNMSNNALLRTDNTGGTAGAGVTIGSTFSSSVVNLAGGQGTINMTTGARIEIAGPDSVSGMAVGRNGSGVLTMSASSINIAGNGSFTVGRAAGSSGVVNMTNNSTITAGWIGIGRQRDSNFVSSNGGVGSLVVNSGSSVTATTIEIGTAGYLGGTGTINGNVINYGTINPGNSPGTLAINGNYTAGAGGKVVLEVESDGSGGYNVDQLIFGPGSTVNLAGATVEFKFLAATDPTAFQASGQFDINTFLKQADSSGNTAPLAPATFASVTFAAAATDFDITSFSYSPSTGVTNLTAVPIPSAVPEPGTWLMLMAGLLGVGLAARRSVPLPKPQPAAA